MLKKLYRYKWLILAGVIVALSFRVWFFDYYLPTVPLSADLGGGEAEIASSEQVADAPPPPPPPPPPPALVLPVPTPPTPAAEPKPAMPGDAAIVSEPAPETDSNEAAMPRGDSGGTVPLGESEGETLAEAEEQAHGLSRADQEEREKLARLEEARKSEAEAKLSQRRAEEEAISMARARAKAEREVEEQQQRQSAATRAEKRKTRGLMLSQRQRRGVIDKQSGAPRTGKAPASGGGLFSGLIGGKLLGKSKPPVQEQEPTRRVEMQPATPAPAPAQTPATAASPPAPEPSPPEADEEVAMMAEAEPAPSNQMEMIFWQSVQNSSDPAAFEAYLAQFPEGVFAPLARMKMASLGAVAEEVTLERYPTMEAPPVAVRGEVIPVQVWLTEELITPEVIVQPAPDVGVTEEGALQLTMPVAESWDFKVVLTAPGFEVDGPGMADITLGRSGDSTPALFQIRATERAKDEVTLRATLWREGAYVASVRRTIKVQAENQPLGLMSQQLPVETAPRRDATSMVTRGAAPDLTLYIHYDDPAALGEGDIIITSPHFAVSGALVRDRINTPPGLIPYLKRQYEALLVEAAAGYRKADGDVDQARAYNRERVIPLVEGLGRRIYLDFAPPAFRTTLDALVKRGVRLETIQVFSNNPVLPWELMVPDVGENAGFLGTDYRVARWHVGNTQALLDKPASTLIAQQLAVIAPKYDVDDFLPHQKKELASLRQIKGYRAVPGRYADLSAIAGRPGPGFVHFSGHGTVFDAGADRIPDFRIKLEDGEVDTLAWRGLAAGAAHTQTLYFFNACDLGYSQSVAGFVDGWAPAVLETGAAGYIGGLWPLIDQTAAEAAGEFYEIALDPESAVPVSEAVQRVRQKFAETGDPTWLAYVYYGDVNLTVQPGGG